MTSSESHLGRREAILTAAERVFNDYGFAGATMEAVAEAAGISKGSVYNYFESKQDLFHQVFAHILAAAEADVGPILGDRNLTAGERLMRLLDYWCGQLDHYRRFGRLVLEFWATAAAHEDGGQLDAALGRMHAHWTGQIAAILEEGIAAGEFNPDFDAEIAARLVMAMLDGIEIQSILGMGAEVDEAFLAAMKRSLLTSLSAGRGGHSLRGAP